MRVLERPGAVLSGCGRYRYQLRRDLPGPPRRGVVGFVLLNPSTADADHDDPTLRRCLGFAARWGAAGVVVGNLFAWRATDPRALAAAPDPVGPHNDRHLAAIAAAADLVVCGWGVHGAGARAAAVIARLAATATPLYHLGLTAGGQPRHPLYLPATTRRRRWRTAPLAG
ncbi:MAG: DUF1643 domain-containing protein [Kofleriaceae bacterium]